MGNAVKVTYADGRVERYPTSRAFERVRLGDERWAFYVRYITSAAWYKRRARHLEQHPNCRGCGRPAILLHHRTYASLGHERHDHLLSLCSKCHLLIHRRIQVRETRLRRQGRDLGSDAARDQRLWSMTNSILRDLWRESGYDPRGPRRPRKPLGRGLSPRQQVEADRLDEEFLQAVL